MYVSDKHPWSNMNIPEYSSVENAAVSTKTQQHAPGVPTPHKLWRQQHPISSAPWKPWFGWWNCSDSRDSSENGLGIIYISLLQVHTKKFSSFLVWATGYLATCTFWYPSQSPLQSKWPTAPPPLVQRWKSTPATKRMEGDGRCKRLS